MAELTDEDRARIMYTSISRLYNSSISHSLTLVVAWLAFVYASRTIALNKMTLIIIVSVLFGMGLYSWIRVLNFKGVLDELETILNIDEFRRRNRLHSFRFIEWLFREMRVGRFTIGDVLGFLVLALLYLFTLLSILQ